MILIIFVSNSLLIQMGNNFSQQRGSQFEHYTSAPHLSTDPRLKVYVNNIGRVFIGKEVDLPYGDYHQMLSHSLKIKKQNVDYYILPISDCIFKPNNSFCSEQDKCLILCQKPQQNLSHLYQQRRLNNQRFSLNSVLSIIDRIAIALRRAQQRFNEKINGLDMSLIFFKGNESYLVDPLIVSEEIEGNGLIQGKYPAPELLQWNKISQNNIDNLSANLFSLGVIAVALCFLHFNIDEIYTVRSTSLYGRKQLNYQFLGHLINLITHSELKERIMVLTHPQTMIRRNIYKIINNNLSLTQSTISQPLTPTKSKNIGKQSVVINRKTPVIPKDDSRQLPRQIVQRVACKSVPLENKQKIIQYPPQKQNLLKVSQIQNQNISIKIASPSHQQPVKIVREAPMIKISAPPLLSSNKENQQSYYNRCKKNTASSQLSITPKKPLVKHEFSTIKEVTQNQQDYSEHKLSQFKASLNFETVYEGNQVDGKKEGYGKCFFPEGSWYEGQWKNDQMHGYGKLYYSNGSLAYQGQWFNSEFHGNGKVYCLKPQLLRTSFDFRDFNTLDEEWVSYEGGLVRDKKHGCGIMILSNGQKYEGQFNNDSLEGHGTFYRMNGSSISGVWRQGRLVAGQQ